MIMKKKTQQKTKSSLSFSKENDDIRVTFIFAWLSVLLYQ